jgi:DNA-binding FrmR family transcriptional regulator
MKKNKKKKEEKTEKLEATHADEIKRLNRVMGQVEGISNMLAEERKLADILAQCKAVRSAIKAIESRILMLHLEKILGEVAKLEKKKSREEQLAELKELFERVE